jgi:hypothetical protein
MNKMIQFASTILVASMVFVSYVDAATIKAVSCSQSDVQAAITAAADGDTVSIPAGSCRWTSSVLMYYKQINIIGAGIDNTLITTTDGGISVRNSAAKPIFRISGMTFTGTATDSAIILISSEWTNAQVKGWRIDHVRFDYNGAIGGAIYVAGINYGVIDNCIFAGPGFVSIYLNSYIDGEWNANSLLGKMGDAAWSLPLNLATDEAVYVEDCTWNFTSSDVSACFDMYNGGRIVFRYNRVNGTYLETHATRGADRGGLKYEIYNNVMNGVRIGQAPFIWPVMLRSGTGVIFNNTVSGYTTNNIIIDNQRSCIAFTGKYTRCNGDNPYDGNTVREYGWPCLDQIGRGAGVAAGKLQPSIPLYSWNNGTTTTCATGGACNNTSVLVLNGNFDLCVSSVPPSLSTHIKTTGDPSPHTGGVLDYVNNGSIPKPGYTPYRYPHPLAAPVPPRNLRIVK